MPTTEKRKVITSYSKMPKDAREAMLQQYPTGYNEEEITKIPKGNNDYLYTVKVETPETVYMVKVDNDIRIAFADDDYLNKGTKNLNSDAVLSQDEFNQLEGKE